MWKLAGFLGIGLVVGFAFASLSNRNSLVSSSADEYAASLFEERIAEVEASLAEARRERRMLEEQLIDIEASMANVSLTPEEFADGPDSAPEFPFLEDAAEPQANAARSARFRLGNRRLNNESLAEDFIAAGIAPDRAQWIIDRTDELRMDALQQRYDAARDGVSVALRAGVDVEQTLRTELGESDYENYLEATGRPTSVGIGSVLASSPASLAGLQPGDQVVSYAGQRVFNMNELNGLTLEGQPGENIAVDVVRDGQQIQLYLPRGPLGVTGGRAFGRRP